MSSWVLSLGSWGASAITHTTLTTVVGQDNSPAHKIIGTKRDHSKLHALQNAFNQYTTTEASLAENICSVVHE